jgi:hypothetical protein
VIVGGQPARNSLLARLTTQTILMSGHGGAASPHPPLNMTGYGSNSQGQSPVSPLDGSLPFDAQYSGIGGDNGPVNGGPSTGDRIQSPDGRVGRRQDPNRGEAREYDQSENRDRSNPRDRSRPHARSHTKSPGSSPRVCKKCGETLTGQFVRALLSTYHLECFKCDVSGTKSDFDWHHQF